VDASLRPVVSAAVAVFSVVFAVGAWAPPSRLTRQRPGSQAQIYATVVNGDKAPVTGLGTADFVLREGGTRLGVLNAVPATDPLSVAIVVIGFDAGALLPIRVAIEDLVRTIAERSSGSRVGLVSRLDSAKPLVTMLTPDAAAIEAALGAGTGSGQDPIAGIVAACDALREAPADRRTVLAIIRPQAGDAAAGSRARLVDAILGARAALWTVEVEPAMPGAPKPSRPNLDDALGEGVRTSGALRERASAGADVPAATARAAARWLSQYLVTYTWPEPMVSVFSLTTRHDAGEVLTPAWMR
jgi:hypothetical protein